MTQKISFQYRDPEDTELLNHRWEGIIEPGVKQGFEVTLGTDPPQTTITIRRGVLVTGDFCRIEESETIIDAQPIPPNETANPRWDLVVCEHRYLRSVPPPVAMYEIIQGEPSVTPTLPNLPPNCIPLAYCYLPAGAVRYTEILNFVTQFKYNCAWDDAAAAWRIVFGAKMALLVTITPNEAPALSATPGLRVFVHAGGVPDGSIITWSRAMELTPQGFTELVALAQEIAAARGGMASLDERLDVALNEDGALRRVGLLDQVMDEVEAARGSMPSLNARLAVSLNDDGSYRRVGILDDFMDEVEAARGSKASVDERLDVSLNDDGTIKTSNSTRLTALNRLAVNCDEDTLSSTSGGIELNVRIKDKGVHTGKIDDLAVTAEKLAADAVETSKIKDEQVTDTKLAEGTITPKRMGLKLSGMSRGFTDGSHQVIEAGNVELLKLTTVWGYLGTGYVTVTNTGTPSRWRMQQVYAKPTYRAVYRLTVSLYLDASFAWASGGYGHIALKIYDDSMSTTETRYVASMQAQNTATPGIVLQGTTLVRLDENDYVEIEVRNASGGDDWLIKDNVWVCFEEV